MNIRKLFRVRYQVRFESHWNMYALFFAGLSIFVLCVHFLGVKNIADLDGGYLLRTFYMPLILLSALGIILQAIRVRNLLVYGILGLLACIYLILSSGGVDILLYILALSALVASVLGYFRGKAIAGFLFGIPGVCGILDIVERATGLEGFLNLLPEAAVFCTALAFSAFSFGLKVEEK